MGRPKGSKNKSTIVKETKGKFTLSSTLSQPEQSQEKNITENVVENTDNDKIKQNNTNQTPKIYKVPPCKNPDNLPEGYEFLSKVQYDKLTQCGKCKAKVLGEPFRIDTNLIAGLCQYHREHPRYIRLCRKCAKQLSDMIDNWLGVEYPDKWQLDMRDDR